MGERTRLSFPSTSTAFLPTFAPSGALPRDKARPPRGRLPGSRRGARRLPRRNGRLRGRLQLLSGQEPRCGRRCRSRRRPTTRSSPTGSARCGSTGSGGSTNTASRGSRRASTRCRRSSSCTSFDTSSGGTRSGARPRATTAKRSRELATCCFPGEPEGARHVWHLYVVRTARRDGLAEHLRENGIGTGLHYPEPPHLSAAYAHLGYGRGAFP